MNTLTRTPRRTLVVADDFLQEAQALRELALGLDFSPRQHAGITYHGIGLQEVDLSEAISRVVGFAVHQRMAFFRLNLTQDNPSTYIHADGCEAEFAGVLHLTAPACCRGGTAFWKHIPTGADRADESLSLTQAEQLNRDGHHELLWDLTSVVMMRFNRFITYPANVFHSRYPKETWGATKQDARLIWAVFYDRA